MVIMMVGDANALVTLPNSCATAPTETALLWVCFEGEDDRDSMGAAVADATGDADNAGLVLLAWCISRMGSGMMMLATDEDRRIRTPAMTGEEEEEGTGVTPPFLARRMCTRELKRWSMAKTRDAAAVAKAAHCSFWGEGVRVCVSLRVRTQNASELSA